jgi:hypothetical protein
MPSTPTYGFPFETPQTKPGITLTGDIDGSSPILAEEVERALTNTDARVAAAEGNIAALQTTDATDTGWLTLTVTPAAGFTAISNVYRRWGPVTMIRVQMNRSGADIVAGATGNVVGDPLMFTITNAAALPDQIIPCMVNCSVTSGGSLIDTSGAVNITDLNSNSAIATGDTARIYATYFTATFS